MKPLFFSIFIILFFAIPEDVANEIVTQKNKYIYYTKGRATGGRDIVRMNANGTGRIFKLTSNNTNGHYPHHNNPKLSPNGKKIVYQSDTDGHDQYAIWTMNIDGSKKQRITKQEGLYPSWSPDGKNIIFSGRRNGIWEIIIVPSSGGDERNVSKNFKKKSHPQWGAISSYHPNGKSIIYTYVREKVLYTMNLQTKEISKLSPSGERYTNAVYSKNGKKIAVNRKIDKGYDLITISPLGGDAQEIAKNVISFSSPAWSDSGREILFVGSIKGNYELFKINLETKKETQLTKDSSFDAFPTW